MDWSEKARRYVETSREEVLALIETLCAIPAPSNREEKRAAFCRDWFAAAGAADVYVDKALNAVCRLNYSEGRPVIVFMAHIDTVFPDLEPFRPQRRDGRIWCPGAGDDTANLALLMLSARYCLREGIGSDSGILFVANAGEEGLGNLKGSRRIMADYAGRVRRVVSFDGGMESVVDAAVGSERYMVRVEAEGGHSFSDFGHSSAIHLLARMIGELYEIEPPARAGSITTYNVGTIQGGTSINTIAQDAEMLYEYRSNDRTCLEEMRRAFEGVVEKYRGRARGLSVELVGSRPSTGDVDAGEQEALAAQVADIVETVTGVRPRRKPGSTDCNIPLSLGVPAVCVGGYRGGGAHTREEWVELDSLPAGMEIVLRVVLSQFRTDVRS